jgi:type II secretory pathway predicted ATPase ExeA
VAQRQSLILLYGDAGVGKTTVITNFLATIDTNEFFAVHLSGTSGEFLGPPSFDALLEIICRRLVGPQPAGQRPATLAIMAAAVEALARAGRTVLLAIDHADHLTNNVIAEVTRLGEYLDAPADSLVCIFIGSPTLASRLDVALRRPGMVKRVPEIRVAHPSGEELAALLAYEDTAVPDGPILTPGAIDRIGVYAKANMHWAGPLADAARTLAANQGEREVTPELVRGALLELWPPEQTQPSDAITRLTSNPATGGNPDVMTRTPPGLSDAPLGSPYGANASVPPVSSSATDPSLSTKLPPGSPSVSERGVARSRAILIQRPGAVRIALAVAVPLLITGIAVLALRDVPDHVAPPAAEQPMSRLPTAQPPDPQGAGEAKQPEQQGNQKNQIGQVPPAEPLPSSAEPSKPWDSEHGQTSNSASNPTSDTPPGLEPAPTTQPVAAPTPARRASNSKKPPAPKASKQDHKQVPLRQWIQTR